MFRKNHKDKVCFKKPAVFSKIAVIILLVLAVSLLSTHAVHAAKLPPSDNYIFVMNSTYVLQLNQSTDALIHAYNIPSITGLASSISTMYNNTYDVIVFTNNSRMVFLNAQTFSATVKTINITPYGAISFNGSDFFISNPSSGNYTYIYSATGAFISKFLLPYGAGALNINGTLYATQGLSPKIANFTVYNFSTMTIEKRFSLGASYGNPSTNLKYSFPLVVGIIGLNANKTIIYNISSGTVKLLSVPYVIVVFVLETPLR